MSTHPLSEHPASAGICEQVPARGVDLLDLHRRHPERYPVLLESVAAGTSAGRFDLLFAFPGPSLARFADGRLSAPPGVARGGSFLDTLDHWWRAEGGGRVAPPTPPLPFGGGWFVYLGYELAAEVEPGLRLPPAPADLPVALALRTPAAVIRDRFRDTLHLVAEAGGEDLVAQMRRDLEACGPVPAGTGAVLAGALVEDPAQAYLDGVERIRRYIRAGDVFQVNLSRAWRGRLMPGVTPAAVYARLRRRNPAPFAACARWGRAALIGSSPERLVRVCGRRVETRPIAGTRPRVSAGGRGAAAPDRAAARALLAHPKERAEHVMLVDLERNDLGRVCAYGSVRVEELMKLESYAHVHHIVSVIAGELRAGTSPAEVIRAVFPGGTITGCPKVRCMEIIAELEAVGRGAYTGSLGYLDRSGDLDLNILIRTMVQSGDRISLRAGAGIVADSVPAYELEETRHKARGLVLALDDAAAGQQ